jgi:hypothetical protein
MKITANGISMNYEIAGDGGWLVLLKTAKVMQRRPHRSILWWRDLRGGRVLHYLCYLL